MAGLRKTTKFPPGFTLFDTVIQSSWFLGLYSMSREVIRQPPSLQALRCRVTLLEETCCRKCLAAGMMGVPPWVFVLISVEGRPT